MIVEAYGDDDRGSMSGFAHVFDGKGVRLHELTAPDVAASDGFGSREAGRVHGLRRLRTVAQWPGSRPPAASLVAPPAA